MLREFWIFMPSKWRKKSYYNSGQLKEVGKYKKGKKNGEWKYFDKNSELIRTKTFANKRGV